MKQVLLRFADHEDDVIEIRVQEYSGRNHTPVTFRWTFPVTKNNRDWGSFMPFTFDAYVKPPVTRLNLPELVAVVGMHYAAPDRKARYRLIGEVPI